MKQLRCNQDGVVALISTIIVGILFVIITVAMIAVVTREAQQAINSDQSNRAYYAAEAGAEEGLLNVKNILNGPCTPTGSQTVFDCRLAALDGLNSSGCNASTGLADNADYTCLTYSRSAPELTGSLTKDGTPLQIDLSGCSPNGDNPACGGYNGIEISWNDPNKDVPFTSSTVLPIFFPTNGSGVGLPAVLELGVVDFDPISGANIDVSNILNSEAVLQPATAGANGSYKSGTPLKATCTANVTTANPYNCKIVLTGIPGGNNRQVLRLRARYNGTHYQLKLTCSSGPTCGADGYVTNIPDQYETVDVTARANNVYRRVREKIAIFQGTAALDYAIFSDTDICKQLTVTFGASVTQSGCPL